MRCRCVPGSLGAIRLGIFAYYIPSSVIKGLLAGIGVILILKQIPHALGFDRDPFGDLDFFQPDGMNTFSELQEAVRHMHAGALVIAVASLSILIAADRLKKRGLALLQFVPGPSLP